MAWSSVGGKAFVSAVRGQMRTVGVAGHLSIVERVKARLSEQTIEAVDAGEGHLRIGGRLSVAGAGVLAGQPANGSATLGYSLNLTSIDDLTIELALELDADEGDDGVWAQLAWASRPGSAKFGFGVQFSQVNLAGRRVPLLTAEQGVGRGAQPLTMAAEVLGGAGGHWWSTYAPAPFVLESDLRALYLTDTAPSQFDLRLEAVSSLLVYQQRLNARVVAGSSPAELIEAYTRFAGRMEPLPDWAHSGAIVGLQGGQEKVHRVVADLKRHGAPLAGVWLQDWVGNRKVPFGQRLWWDWQRNPDSYPQWDEMVAKLGAQELQTLVYINPFLSPMSERPGERPDLFSAAEAGSHFVKDESGRTLLTDQGDFLAGLVDLSSPSAREWYLQTLTEQLHETAARGWMADFGEGLPLDARLAEGDALSWHNRYPQEWADFNRQLRERLAARSGREPEDYVAFFRSGFTRSPAGASLFWLGDQTVTWDEHDGLRSALKGLLSSGFSGYSLQHGDVGGYTSTVSPLPRRTRSRELLARWGEMLAFTVVLRTHEGNRPALNTQVYSTQETLADFARAARLHAAWRELRSELMAEAAATGMPVVRHSWLAFPDDQRTVRLTSQFFLGDELLVAPVVNPGANAVRAYLPAGSGVWTHAFAARQAHASVAAAGTKAAGPAAADTTAGESGQLGEYEAADGRWVSVPAPLGSPGVFVRGRGSGHNADLLQRLRAAVSFSR